MVRSASHPNTCCIRCSSTDAVVAMLLKRLYPLRSTAIRIALNEIRLVVEKKMCKREAVVRSASHPNTCCIRCSSTDAVVAMLLERLYPLRSTAIRIALNALTIR